MTWDEDFQRIAFHKSDNSPIRDKKLKSVTFGINCAPYLAIRHCTKWKTLWN